MAPSREHPVIEGWNVAPTADGRTWTAARLDPLSPAQLEYGCRLVVGANSFGELQVACIAEGVKASIVAAAERMAEQMLEAERRRALDQAAPNEPGAGINT